MTVLGLGLAALTLMVLGERFLPERPIPLLVVALAIVVVSITSIEQVGVATVGVLPRGLPEFTLPSLRLRDVDGILPLGCACFLLACIEGISAARTLAAKNDDPVDARQELLALGAANLAVAFGQGFPVAGGLSQSAVNEKAGARTPLALVFASVTLAACLLLLTGLLGNLPSVVLAAVVLVVVRGLVDVGALRHLWQVSPLEFKISIVSPVAVLLLGILKGVMFASIASLLMLLAGAARPQVAFLGWIPGTVRYSDLERHPDNRSLPGIIISRVESSLLYFNVDHVRQSVWARVQSTSQFRLVVCDLSDGPFIDVAGAGMLTALHYELTKRGGNSASSKPMRRLATCSGLRDWRSMSDTSDGIRQFTRRLSNRQESKANRARRFPDRQMRRTPSCHSVIKRFPAVSPPVSYRKFDVMKQTICEPSGQTMSLLF